MLFGSIVVRLIIEQDLLKFLNEKPSAYLDEMVWFIWDEYNVEVSESTLSRVLKSLHWSKNSLSISYFIWMKDLTCRVLKQRQRGIKLPGMIGLNV